MGGEGSLHRQKSGVRSYKPGKNRRGEQEKKGAIGESEANRVKEIRVAENTAEAQKGMKKAEADQRIYIEQQEAHAVIGEAEATKQKTIGVAENIAETEKGKKKAEADQRIIVQQQEALAINGENRAKADIAAANAELEVKQAVALQRGEVARREAEVEIQKAQYRAEHQRLTAAEVVRQEINKQKVEIDAEAEAEKCRREAKGQADAILLKYQAEAEGIRKVLEGKADGYLGLIKGCNGDAKATATLLMTEKIEQIVQLQVEAIKNIKIDKVTVWDSAGNGSGDGNTTSTANFLSGLIKSLPPLHDVAGIAGIDLPKYLGEISEKTQVAAQEGTLEEKPGSAQG